MLTVKQEKFCIEYAKTGNARQAYINAGYKHKKDNVTDAAASRLLSNVKVKTRLQELAEEIKNEAIADVKEMQETLTNIIRQSLKEEVIVTEGCGEGCSEARTVLKKPAIKEVISAINTLGKMQGAFIDKLELDVEPVVIVNDLKE